MANGLIDLNIKQQTVNPRTVLVKNHTIPVLVKKVYTDINGTIIDKATLPAALQTRMPVFLLGQFDFAGGYKIAQQSVRVSPVWTLLKCFVQGVGSFLDIIGFTGLSDIQNEIKSGDILQVYTDDVINPSYFCWIIVQNTYASIASIIANTESTQNDRRIGPIAIHAINYLADTNDQLSESIFILNYSNIGTFRSNSIDPLGMYRTPYDVQVGLVTINLQPLYLDQYTGIAFNQIFDSDQISFDFKIKTY